MDGEGMTPEGMDALLSGWNPDEHNGMSRCVNHAVSLADVELLPRIPPRRRSD